MKTLEEAFEHTQESAETAKNSAQKVVSLASQMTRNAKLGNIAAIKRLQGNLNVALDALQEDIAHATACWPYTEEQEREIFSETFVTELLDHAKQSELSIYEHDGAYVSYPSIVRILPAERAVRVDRKKVSSVRPSFLVEFLIKNQKRSSSFAAARLLESMYDIYNELTIKPRSDLLQNISEEVIPLIKIYKLLTSLPGVAREYGRSDFARDLYTLERDGPHETRKGAAVSFPASTGTRTRAGDLFSFIGPDGDRVVYYGVQFTKQSK